MGNAVPDDLHIAGTSRMENPLRRWLVFDKFINQDI